MGPHAFYPVRDLGAADHAEDDPGTLHRHVDNGQRGADGHHSGDHVRGRKSASDGSEIDSSKRRRGSDHRQSHGRQGKELLFELHSFTSCFSYPVPPGRPISPVADEIEDGSDASRHQEAEQDRRESGAKCQRNFSATWHGCDR